MYLEQAREVIAANGVLGAEKDLAQLATSEANARAPAGRA